MRSIILLAVSLFMVSCVTKTEEKSCTYNGEPCKEESPVRPGYGDQNPLRDAMLQVSVKSSITKLPYKIELLENTIDSKEYAIKGDTYLCEAKTETSTIWTFKISSGLLTIMEERLDRSVNVRIYERLSGYGRGAEGSWESRTSYGNRLEVRKLEISENSLKLQVECRYKTEV
jgi:hypothetical protein